MTVKPKISKIVEKPAATKAMLVAETTANPSAKAKAIIIKSESRLK
jgi:hypothetical protein